MNIFLELIELIILVFFVGLILFFTFQIKKGKEPLLRFIPAFQVLKRLIAEAIESGRTIHLALGTGRISTQASADTLAGLTMLEYIADLTTAANTPSITTTADPTTMILAETVLQRAYNANHHIGHPTENHVHWISPEPAAYAGGVMNLFALNDIASNIMIGHFGDEYLLMAESTYKQQEPIPTVAGTSDPNVIPYVYTTSPQGLWGEEMFAVGAYLSKKPIHIGSLLAQDTMRWIVSLTILGGVLLKLIL